LGDIVGRLIELNHVIRDGMPVYPGLPTPKITTFLSHKESRSRYDWRAEFHIGRLEMVGNTATYLDSPFHRYPDALDLSQIPIERVAALQGIVLDAETLDREVRIENLEFDRRELENKAVLIRTGWDQRWGSEAYWEPGPYLSEELSDYLVESKAALVGVDFWNVDDIFNPARPVHTKLLAASILIVENLCNLFALPRRNFRFYAVPLRIAKGSSIPVRAFAEID
jgi:kynurenine formamidase